MSKLLMLCVEKLENIIDRVLSKGSNINYIENEKVEFDL